MRSFWKLAVLASLSAAGAGTTSAEAAGGSIWDHNGSKMTLEENGDKRKLVYTGLRDGLDKAGIRQGTVLFNGEKKANGRLAGFAKIFKGTCNPVDYFVEGTLNEAKGEIVLQGQAPVYAAGASCEVTGYSDSSPASTLRFAKISDAPAADVVAGRAPDAQIEQGDRSPADEGYLPPVQHGRSTARAEEPDQSPPAAQSGQRPPPRQGYAPGAQGQDQDRNRSAYGDEDDRDDRGYAAPRQRDDVAPHERYGRNDDGYDDRRYSRGPDPYDERSYRRRPGIWDPEDELAPDADSNSDDDDYDRPAPRPWGRRW
jgi:hypothetical protein